jgi:hypothetical protein
MTKLTAGIAALAVFGFTGSALAQQIDAQNYAVGVNIIVEEHVSIWSNDTSFDLIMQGNDGNNSATALGTMYYNNNVPATISALVEGDLPTDGGGVNFFIFWNQPSEAAAVAAFGPNAYNPAGAKVWTNATMGTSQQLASVAEEYEYATVPVVYASNSPGGIPAPVTEELTVTYTIAETN